MQTTENTKKRSKGFTLVELIIVIMILSVLAIIAIMSFRGYSSKARDSNRLASINAVEKGLNIFQTKTAVYPNPENPTELTASGAPIGLQGYFGENGVRAINLNTIPLDPADNQKYIYLVNSKNTKYQMMAYMEAKTQLSMLPQTYALDYTGREVQVFGSNLGILLNTDNSQISGSGIDIVTTTSTYKAIINNTSSGVLSGTGKVLREMNPNSSCKRIFESGIGTLDGEYLINPDGGSGFVVYCLKQIPNMNFYNTIVDGDFEKADGTNWNNTFKSTDAKQNGNTGLKVVGSLQFSSNDYTFVDSSKKYRLEGFFRSAGTVNSKVHFGYIEYDKNYRVIGNDPVNVVLGTETVLTQNVIASDTTVTFADNGTICSNWSTDAQFGTFASIAFGIDDSGEYNDLPNYDRSSAGFSSIVDNGSTCTLTLKNPVGKTYSLGTKIRMHRSGGSYNYVANSGNIVSQSWTKYEGTVSGISKYGVNVLQFRRGTQFVRVLVIANYLQGTDSILYMDDLKLEVAK